MSKEMDSIDNIPDEPKTLKQWACWNSTKFPINPITGKKAEVDNPATWCTFEEARKAKADCRIYPQPVSKSINKCFQYNCLENAIASRL